MCSGLRMAFFLETGNDLNYNETVSCLFVCFIVPLFVFHLFVCLLLVLPLSYCRLDYFILLLPHYVLIPLKLFLDRHDTQFLQ